MADVTPYPLLFEPIYREKVWGGRELERLGRTLPPGMSVGESWELADLPESVPDGQSKILNGPLAGRTLAAALAEHGAWIMGDAPLTPAGRFPLLIKYLDARENLSVQVHPDEAYAARHPEAHLKSEAWVVIDAAPGAAIYKGVKPEITREEFAAAIEQGEVERCLVRLPVQAGDCHYLPSGTCHALGAGVVVAEVQTPSDTTFRVYDWGRRGREMHVAEALECIAFGAAAEGAAIGPTLASDGVRVTGLLRTAFFSIDRVEMDQARREEVVTPAAPSVWMVQAGGIAMEIPGAKRVDIGRSVTVLLPAALSNAMGAFEGGTTFLRVNLPSTLEGLIA